MGSLKRVRTLLLGTLLLGLAGLLLELVLIEHYEDPWQIAPLILIPTAMLALVAYNAQPTMMALRAVQAVMGLIMIAGLLGVALHFDGAAEFQREIDPSMDSATLFAKVIRAKAPPVLAPGLMTQLGLLGFVYLYADQASRLITERSD